MNLYYKLLYLLLNKEIFEKYKEAIDITSFKGSFPILYKLFVSLHKLHESTTSSQATVKDLETSFLTLYPNENQRELDIVFSHIERDGSEANQELLLTYLKECKARLIAYEVTKLSIAVADGERTAESLREGLEKALEDLEIGAQTLVNDTDFITDDLEILYEDNVKDVGLRWRLASLNKSLGSLRKGDFGFIFARPETGKTTFLASEVTYMASQLNVSDGPILWINNEEQGAKVMLRCYQAALDLTMQELAKDLKKNKELFNNLIKNKLKIYDKDRIFKSEIETLTTSCQPSLIVIDQIDKIQGFEADRDDLKLGEIYKWARSLAKRFCPVIGICQADGSGEGIKALNMNNVANAKTSKQAEADFILGIGKTHNKDEEYIRYFNISKNKLFGDADSEPNLKHDFWEVEIDPQHARYRDFTYIKDDYANLRSKK
jgi:hypothetical protein